jgi:hypothetical protein
MISQSLVARIRRAFPEPLCQAFVAALAEAYQEVGSFHRPERGFNSFTFGVNVWTIAQFQLHELVREQAWDLEEGVEHQRVTFVKDGLHLSCYKVGSSSEQNIFSSFPNNQNAAKRLVQNNHQYDLFGYGYHQDAPMDLVLAHLGNPERGLEAVYLCVPSAIGTDDRISEWAYAQVLWRRDARRAIEPAGAVLAEEVTIERPTIRLKVQPAAEHR